MSSTPMNRPLLWEITPTVPAPKGPHHFYPPRRAVPVLPRDAVRPDPAYRSSTPMQIAADVVLSLRLDYRGWTMVPHSRAGGSWYAYSGAGLGYRCVTGPSPIALVKGIDERTPPFTTRTPAKVFEALAEAEAKDSKEDSAVAFAKAVLGLP